MNKKPLIKHGWLRVVIFVILIAAPGAFLHLPMTQAYVPGYIKEFFDTSTQKFPMLFLSYLGTNGFMLVLAFLFCQFVDRRSFLGIGFDWREYEADAWTGFFAGINLLATGTLILMLTGTISFSLILPNFVQLLYSILFFILVAFVEEIVCRGYIQRNLMLSIPPSHALIVSALIYAALHLTNPSIGIVPLANLFIAGLLFGINYMYTQNLWYGIFLHFSWNLVQGPLFGYPVSGLGISSFIQQSLNGPDYITGGNYGFEGSAIAAALILGLTYWVSTMYSGSRVHKLK